MTMKAIITAAVMAAVAGGAQAAPLIIDFTDRSVWSGKDAAATSSANYGTLNVQLSTRPKNKVDFTQDFDAVPAAQPFCGTLACVSDGLGIGGDEVTAIDLSLSPPIQSATLTFNKSVRITGIHFLDLFTDQPGGADTTFEQANVYVDGTPGVTPIPTVTTFKAVEKFQENGGYAFASTNIVAANTATFFASSFPNNDGVGKPDFALAALEVSVIPLPASALLFGAALGGLGVVGRRKKKAVATA